MANIFTAERFKYGTCKIQKLGWIDGHKKEKIMYKRKEEGDTKGREQVRKDTKDPRKKTKKRKDTKGKTQGKKRRGIQVKGGRLQRRKEGCKEAKI